MAKKCGTCQAKLGLFHSGPLICKECSTRLDALEKKIEVALEDDILTADEETILNVLVEQAGFSWTGVATHNHPLVERVVVAKANDGRLETITGATILTGAGEVVHLETPAAVMSERVLREFQGGSRGVSVPLGHGVRVRTGSFRGHSVVVGTQMVASDSGTMTVSSKRLVFAGGKSTIEIPLLKLVEVQAFTDGVLIHASNRKAAPLFRTGISGPIVAATIAAARRALSS